MGQGPAPKELRTLLLMTGERGLGWAAVYGDRRVTLREFEIYSFIQQRIALVQTDKGRDALSNEVAAQRAIALEQRRQERARQAAVAETIRQRFGRALPGLPAPSDDADGPGASGDEAAADAPQPPPVQGLPFDPSVMTPEQAHAWIIRQNHNPA